MLPKGAEGRCLCPSAKRMPSLRELPCASLRPCDGGKRPKPSSCRHRSTRVPLAFAFAVLAALSSCSGAKAEDWGPDGLPLAQPMIIAQGGARGEYPLYSLQAYRKALANGARNLECRVCFTRDGHAVCCPGVNLEYISDAKQNGGGRLVHLYTPHLLINENEPLRTGWFIFNFTLQQLRYLHIVNDERHPRTVVSGRRGIQFRWPPRAYLATVRELLDLALTWNHAKEMVLDAANTVADTPADGEGTPSHPGVRVILEPLYAEFMLREFDIYPEKILVDILGEYQLLPPETQAAVDDMAQSPGAEAEEEPLAPPAMPFQYQRGGEGQSLVAAHIQSKNLGFLRAVRAYAPALPLIYVVDIDWDQPDCSYPITEPRASREEWVREAWDQIRQFAWAVAVNKDLLLPRNGSNYLVGGANYLVGGSIQDRDGQTVVSEVSAAARERGLKIFAFSFCQPVPKPMAFDFSFDPYAELEAFIKGVGVDGLYTSCPRFSIRFIELQEAVNDDSLGWSEIFTVAFFVLLALLPMGLGLLYAIHKWRESERYREWQEFSMGSSDLRSPTPRSRGQMDAGLVLQALGASAPRQFEHVPLNEEEFDPRGAAEGGSGLLKGGESKSTAGTWRMRKGSEWNSDDSYT